MDSGRRLFSSPNNLHSSAQTMACVLFLWIAIYEGLRFWGSKRVSQRPLPEDAESVPNPLRFFHTHSYSSKYEKCPLEVSD